MKIRNAVVCRGVLNEGLMVTVVLLDVDVIWMTSSSSLSGVVVITVVVGGVLVVVYDRGIGTSLSRRPAHYPIIPHMNDLHIAKAYRIQMINIQRHAIKEQTFYAV